MASGSGSTAEAFIHATQDGRVDAEVGLVVCNNPPGKAGIYERVARLNGQYGLDIEMAHISGRTHPDGKVGRGQTLAESEAICKKISYGGFAHVALMGYMKVIRGDLMDEYGYDPELHLSPYEARMSNTHPGPNPETADKFGIQCSAEVIRLRLRISKHIVFMVTLGIDQGPIIAEHPVEVRPDDTPETLFDRVQTTEKAALPYALDRLLKNQAAYNDPSLHLPIS